MQFDRFIGALRERNFRLYFIGQMTSATGTGMTIVALAFAVLAGHRSASALGAVFAAETLPLALFLLVGGVAADRLGRRFVMIGSDALRSAAMGAMAAWVLIGRPPLWGFLLLSALVGTGTAFFVPSSTGLIPAVVSQENLSQANAMVGLTFSIGGMLGPALAGVVVATTSPGWAMLADAVTYVVSFGSMLMMRLGAQEASPAGESFFHQLRTGWREFRSRTWLWVIVAQWAIGNVAIMAPFMVLGAVVAKQSLGGASAWGTILACQGIGAIVGGLVMLRLKPRRPLVVATASAFVFPLSMVALGLRAPLALIAASAGLMGLSMAVFAVLWDTTMQREVPPEVLSRVSSYDWFGSLVFLPLGYAVIGPVSAAIGVRGTFLLSAGYAAGSSVLVLCVPAVRHMRWRDSPVEVKAAGDAEVADRLAASASASAPLAAD
ncbi:MAG TPA: MFS transporter [Acidimicrobiales bacterium]|nr:MFS transporter [Acidimicrobiales bacterium]